MIVLGAIRQLAADLRGQRLRTILTAFGIVWGTTAVSLLLAFGEGFHRQLLKSQAGLGNRIVIAWPSLTSVPFEGLGRGRAVRLDEEDARLLRESARGLEAISPEYDRELSVRLGPRVLSVPVSGVEPVFASLRSLVPERGGRFLDALDLAERRRVAFLGNELATQLFGSADPVGQTIRLEGAPFVVVGVLREKVQNSNYSGPDKNRLWIPASTFRAMTGQRYLDNLIYRASNVAATEELETEVRTLLARRHRFDPADQEAIQIWDTTEAFRFLDVFMTAFRLFLGVVGSLTLVVGGIGVSNIMSVVVEERTREIGIRMALGAKPRSILGQFLLETIVLTAVGGGAGLALTAAICAVFPSAGLTDYVGAPALSPAVAGATALLLGSVGFFSGWFPARRAARLDPVVAMRS